MKKKTLFDDIKDALAKHPNAKTSDTIYIFELIKFQLLREQE